jgi:hypothetical protein
MHGRTTRSAWCIIGIGSVLAVGCAPRSHTRALVVPSLRPVDTARPMVVFSQVQGKACGRDAVLGAIRDMKRLMDVDGYLEVVIDETVTGEQRCAQATAYPFRYGVSSDNPVIRAGDESTKPVLIPGRPQATLASSAPVSSGGSTDGGSSVAPPPFNCADACQRFAPLVETGTIKIALAKDRCEQRCKQPDLGFQKCIERAHEPATAKACLTP